GTDRSEKRCLTPFFRKRCLTPIFEARCRSFGGTSTMRMKTYHPPGTSPGTLVEREREPDGGLSIRLIDYTHDGFTERALATAQDCKAYLASDSRTWIQVNGRPDPETLRELGAQFGL